MTIRVHKELSAEHARSLVQQGDYDGAIKIYKELVSINPSDAKLHHDLGVIYYLLKQYQLAIQCGSQAIVLDQNRALTHYHIGLSYNEIGNFEAANVSFNKAYDLGYNQDRSFFLTWGNILRYLGDFSKAEEMLLQAYKYGAQIQAISCLSSIKLFQDQNDPMIKQAKLLFENCEGKNNEQTKKLGFALGKMLDDCGNYQQAFSYYAKANQIMYNHLRADNAVIALERESNTLKEVFTLIGRQLPNCCPDDNFKPIFIVGLPRSGTSLVEQILASHSQVYAAGELPYGPNLVKHSRKLVEHSGKSYLWHYEELDKKHMQQLKDFYVDGANKKNHTKRKVIVDKLPDNYFHLGLLSKLFPHMVVINCIRHPLDVCLSMYFTYFSRKWSFYYDLKDIARQYKCYQRTMNFWKNNLDIPILDVKYDSLVGDIKTKSKQIMSHCGLDWQPQCAQFYKHERSVQTASVWQVRQPIYNSSIGRWRNYKEHIIFLEEMLSDEISIYTKS